MNSMKLSHSRHRQRGLTLLELFVVVAVVTIFFMVFMCGVSFDNARPRALRIQCITNLKQIGLAFRVWAGDNGGKYPMEISETNGGSMEFITGANVFRHFQVMSNELSTPKVLYCPADEARTSATNFGFFSNSNVSFFLGVNAPKGDPQAIFAGDRNITNGDPVKNGILELTKNRPVDWNDEIHKKEGNILLFDGSVRQVIWFGLRTAVENPSAFTNRLQMPILNP